jgi:AcrR family transcriptional regulator
VSAERGLRERKKQRTRELLADTARRLFAERGFEHVSVAQIAREADVSQATVFNYFPTKEDLVYSGLETFEEQLLAAVRERPAGRTVLDAFADFVTAPRGFLASSDEESARQLVALSRVIASSPALRAREQQIFDRMADALAEEIAGEMRSAAGDLRPSVAANALIGVHRALIGYVRGRLQTGTPDRAQIARDVRKRGREAFGLLAEGLGDYAPRR